MSSEDFDEVLASLLAKHDFANEGQRESLINLHRQLKEQYENYVGEIDEGMLSPPAPDPSAMILEANFRRAQMAVEINEELVNSFSEHSDMMEQIARQVRQ